MRLTTILALFTLFICNVSYVGSTHFVIGNVADRVTLQHHELVQYNAIPFVKRVKQYFYNGPAGKKIQGIQALDTLQSKASINITAGGIGYSYVNFRLKSERGRGLAYDIGIYVNPGYM